MDYELSLDMAKELAMLEKNEQGRAARRWFIQAEKMLRHMLETLHQPINGVFPLYQNKTLGYPRKDLLISVDRSHKNGYRLAQRYPQDTFLMGRTACVSPKLARFLVAEYEAKQLQTELFTETKQLA